MENRTNNIFIAFALWAGAWALLDFFDYWAFELQRALVNLPVHAPISLVDLPALGAFVVVLISSRIWKAPIMALLFMFVMFEFIRAILGLAASSSYYLLCSPNVCTGAWSHDFGMRSLAFDGIGYIAASILLHAVRLASGRTEYNGSRNPLAYVAHLIARMARGMSAWLQLDVDGIKALWKKWAALPLWPSGRIIANAVRPFWVPYFGLAAAITVADQIILQYAPFIQPQAPYLGLDPAWGLVGVGIGLSLACVLVAAWTAGRVTAELGWKVSKFATIIAVLFVLFWQVEWLISVARLNSASSTEGYLALLQNLGDISVLFLGYWLGYQREIKRRRALLMVTENAGK